MIDDFIQVVMRMAVSLRQDPETDFWLDPDEMSWDAGEQARPWARRNALVRGGLEALSRSVAVSLPREPLFADAGGAAVAFPERALPSARRRQPRRTRWSTRRKRRFLTRFVPCVALLFSAFVAGSWYFARDASPSDTPLRAPLALTPTSAGAFSIPEVIEVPPAETGVALPADLSRAIESLIEARGEVPEIPVAAEKPFLEIKWRESTAVGLPNSGRLVDGVRLPIEGPDWVTWDPVRDHVPNRRGRLWATDDLVRVVVDVLREYRVAHPNAPRVLVGDLSRKAGGPLDQHVSHENGLDVDIYYPRLDHRLRPARTVQQIDRRLAQHLVDAFVARGAELVLVGPDTGLKGPRQKVMPYTGHNDHLHARLPGS